jgi:hypothetical protein
MKRFALVSLVVPFAVAMWGCSDDGSGSKKPPSSSPSTTPSGAPSDFRMTCQAGVRAATSNFEIASATASSMTLIGSDGSRLELPRVGGKTDTGHALYGDWKLPVQPVSEPNPHGLAITSTISISASRISVVSNCSSKWHSLRAEASSPLKIVDAPAQPGLLSGTLEILEAHSEEKEWTTASGEALLSKRSVVPFGKPGEAAPEPGFFLGASFPPGPTEE